MPGSGLGLRVITWDFEQPDVKILVALDVDGISGDEAKKQALAHIHQAATACGIDVRLP